MSKPNKINYLGTYIVRIENIEVQRAEQYIDYLLNGDHDNHIDKTEILNNIGEKDKYIVNNKLKIAKNKENKQGKGGKPLKVSDKSLTFNIPVDYACSSEQLITMQKILFKAILTIYKEYNVDVSEIDFYSNIHNQRNKHINFAIPYLDQNGKTIPFIKSKDFLKLVSRTFTMIVDNVLGTNIKTYKTELDQMAKASEIMDNIADLELSDIQELKVKHKDNKLVKRALDYVYKIINGVDNNKDISKHIDNLLNTTNKISNDKKLTKEEAEDFKKALQSQKLLGSLTPDGREKILKSMPTSTKTK